MKWYGNRLERQVKRQLNRNISDACGFLEKTIKQSMTGEKTGNKYYGQPTTSSAPGEPPASQSGTLMRSITSEFDERNIGGRVGTNVEYGRFLELGTKNMSPRPYLRPAIEKNKISLASKIKKGFK